MSAHFKRWVTGSVLAVAALAVNFGLPPQAFCALVVVAALAAELELLGMVFEGGSKPYRVQGFVTGAAVLASSFFGSARLLAGVFLAMVMASFMGHLFSVREIERAVAGLGKQLIGLCYVPLLASLFVLVRLEPQGAWWVTFGMLVVFLGDMGAYYAGTSFGRHALYRAVSPNKTWEGSVGGLAAALASALLFRALFMPRWPVLECIALCVVISCFAQVGDLFESLLKRSVGTKDSGTLLPGHGGMLDRIDGALFAGPPLYVYVNLFYVGQP